MGIPKSDLEWSNNDALVTLYLPFICVQRFGRRHMLNNQHLSSDIIAWQAPVPKATSVYRYSFTDAVKTHQTSKSCPDLCFHRYTKNYAVEKKRVMHTTISKQPEVTPLSTLAITQLPQQEPWKYSYKFHKI